MKLRWLSRALSELDRVFEYLSRENPEAARRVFWQIREATNTLRRFPDSGRLGQVPGTRELIVTHLPYLVVYRVTDTEVQILRVLHTRQDIQ